jgi:hypothetical protein
MQSVEINGQDGIVFQTVEHSKLSAVRTPNPKIDMAIISQNVSKFFLWHSSAIMLLNIIF